VPGDPLVLFNIWDSAIATGSYGVAEAHGLADGETVPLDLVLANLARIVAVAGGLPVTLDMESGYGATAQAVGASVARARQAAAAGINMEDRLPGESALVPLAEQQERIAAAAASGLFVNARCDVFRGRDLAAERPTLIAQLLQRARAYADAGAMGLFVPFVDDPAVIAELCQSSPLPVNVLWAPSLGDRAAIAALGVARISHGHQPWAAAMAWLGREVERVLGGGVPGYAG
jgi:2-methylisocitrate lyase-like PEP mutase family enzyme